MFKFDQKRFEKVVDGAIALRPEIEKCVDRICEEGYKNLFLIGVGGTYAHYLPLQSMVKTLSDLPVYVEMAAEFMALENKYFSKDSVCVFCSRTGNTKEIVEAAKYCRDRGARVVAFVAHEGTPLCELADYVFVNYADDDHLGESIYLQILPFVFRFLKNRGDFSSYETMFSQIGALTPYLVAAKEQTETMAEELARKHKDTSYHMVVGSGFVWGEVYDYAMCILEEMQWIKTKSIHATEFFHGTLELVEEDTSLLLFYGEDATRPLMDRVEKFVSKITRNVAIFDTRDVKLPLDEAYRPYVSPLVIYCMLERFSCHLAHVRNHPLETRRYYRQIEY